MFNSLLSPPPRSWACRAFGARVALKCNASSASAKQVYSYTPPLLWRTCLRRTRLRWKVHTRTHTHIYIYTSTPYRMFIAVGVPYRPTQPLPRPNSLCRHLSLPPHISLPRHVYGARCVSYTPGGGTIVRGQIQEQVHVCVCVCVFLCVGVRVCMSV